MFISISSSLWDVKCFLIRQDVTRIILSGVLGIPEEVGLSLKDEKAVLRALPPVHVPEESKNLSPQGK